MWFLTSLGLLIGSLALPLTDPFLNAPRRWYVAIGGLILAWVSLGIGLARLF